MDPNFQDKTNKKIDSYISVIHSKVDYINEQLNTKIDEINSTFKQFIGYPTEMTLFEAVYGQRPPSVIPYILGVSKVQ
jgi:hypothetical protein